MIKYLLNLFSLKRVCVLKYSNYSLYTSQYEAYYWAHRNTLMFRLFWYFKIIRDHYKIPYGCDDQELTAYEKGLDHTDKRHKTQIP